MERGRHKVRRFVVAFRVRSLVKGILSTTQ